MEEPGISVIYPNYGRILELSSMIGQFSADQIKDALRKKDGEIYDIIGSRGRILKANFHNRREIARLNIILQKLDGGEKECLEDAVKSGAIESPVRIASLIENERKKLARYMNRCGIACSLNGEEIIGEEPEEKEVGLTIGRQRIWLNTEDAEKIRETIGRIEQLGCQLQVNYAKKHVVSFNEKQEEEYNAMQKEYIELLKIKDEILGKVD